MSTDQRYYLAEVRVRIKADSVFDAETRLLVAMHKTNEDLDNWDFGSGKACLDSDQDPSEDLKR